MAAPANEITAAPLFVAAEPPEMPVSTYESEVVSKRGSGDVSDDTTASARSKWRVFAIMTALLLSLFLAAVNFTIVTTAIPTISAHFHSASGYTWIGSSTSLANAASGPIWGKLSDIWGRKPILLFATIIFALSATICATAHSMTTLLVGRALQGVGSCGLILLVNICISDLFSVRKRGLFFGMTEFVWAIAGGAGPLIGGAFSEYVSWRWSWYFNLPFTGVAFILTLLFLDVHNPRTSVLAGLKAIDWFGCLTILGFTLMLLLGLDFGGETYAWNSATVICLIIFGCLMSGLFFFGEAKIASHPMIPIKILKRRSNVATLAIAFAHGFCFMGAEYYLPLYFQSVKQLTPFQSGLLVLPLSVTEAVSGGICGLIIHSTGHYMEMIYTGAILQTLGIGLFIHFGANSSIGEIVGLQIIVGIGAGVLFTPPLIALQALTPQSETATATSTFTFIRNVATCLSIVVGGVIFQNGMSLQVSNLRAAGIADDIVKSFSGEQAAANVKLIGMLHGSQQMAAKKAFAWSLRNCWIMYCVIAGISVVASIFVTRQNLATHHTETKTGLVEKENNMTELAER